jgi:predicted nucleic acid-binding protein
MTRPGADESFLLDTNVVSETRRRRPDPLVAGYLARIRESRVCLSCLTIGELIKGASAKMRTDPVEGDTLLRWVDSIEAQFRDRILPVDDEVSRVWGRLSAARSRPVVDALIAATAIVHDMTLVTRNVTDMNDTGARLVDPWRAAQEGGRS